MAPSANAVPSRSPRDPALDGGFVGPVLAAAWSAWRRHWQVIALVVLVLAVADMPFLVSQSVAQARLDELSREGTGTSASQATPEQLELAGREALSMCGAWCCGQGYALLVMLPLVAGAMAAGARAARGTVRLADLGCGFRRYGAVLVAALATTLVGGGVAVTMVVLTSLSTLSSAARSLGGLVPPAVVGTVLAVIVAVTVWLSARLWFALARAADPDRPPIGGIEAMTRTWQWTGGPVQWRLVGTLLLCGATAVVCLLPGGALADVPGPDGPPRPSGWVSMPVIAAGALIAVTVFMLVMGAAYERLASVREPIAPPVVPLPAEGGFDA